MRRPGLLGAFGLRAALLPLSPSQPCWRLAAKPPLPSAAGLRPRQSGRSLPQSKGAARGRGPIPLRQGSALCCFCLCGAPFCGLAEPEADKSVRAPLGSLRPICEICEICGPSGFPVADGQGGRAAEDRRTLRRCARSGVGSGIHQRSTIRHSPLFPLRFHHLCGAPSGEADKRVRAALSMALWDRAPYLFADLPCVPRLP